MIHYDLRCGEGHTFDSWFRSSAAFDQQAAAGLLDCPFCASTDVTRAIMAPRLNLGVSAPPEEKGASVDSPVDAKSVSAPAGGARAVVPAPGQELAASVPPSMPDQVRAVLQRLRTEVEQRCEYVGGRFADEARAMHHGEQPRRSIYGETSPDDAEALAEEGIEVARIPWVPRADS
jgi:hypothetical protein